MDEGVSAEGVVMIEGVQQHEGHERVAASS